VARGLNFGSLLGWRAGGERGEREGGEKAAAAPPPTGFSGGSRVAGLRRSASAVALKKFAAGRRRRRRQRRREGRKSYFETTLNGDEDDDDDERDDEAIVPKRRVQFGLNAGEREEGSGAMASRGSGEEVEPVSEADSLVPLLDEGREEEREEEVVLSPRGIQHNENMLLGRRRERIGGEERGFFNRVFNAPFLALPEVDPCDGGRAKLAAIGGRSLDVPSTSTPSSSSSFRRSASTEVPSLSSTVADFDVEPRSSTTGNNNGSPGDNPSSSPSTTAGGISPGDFGPSSAACTSPGMTVSDAAAAFRHPPHPQRPTRLGASSAVGVGLQRALTLPANAHEMDL